MSSHSNKNTSDENGSETLAKNTVSEITHIRPLLRIADFLDTLIRTIGSWFCWISVALIFFIILQVILRYAFKSGLIFLEEIQWHLYGVLIMMGLSYGQVTGAHVRVDLVHQYFSRKTKAWIEIIGFLLLLAPFTFVLFDHSWDFMYEAWRLDEGSDAPEGLPMRWVIKSAIPLGMALLFVSGFSQFLRDIVKVTDHGSE
ncbi:MAG: TRAP transporter small permease subunit [SAR324 cluster bacterium]|nr:TRAP transporter small permease subunit [SAR324 cluster bacterium]